MKVILHGCPVILDARVMVMVKVAMVSLSGDYSLVHHFQSSNVIRQIISYLETPASAHQLSAHGHNPTINDA
jgi:hypothetical protein